MHHMQRTFWEPWRELEELRRRMGQTLTTQYDANREFPPVNIWTNAEGALLTSEVPGIELKDVDVSVLGETITVRGKRERRSIEEGEKFHRRERGHGPFSRSFQLPFRIDPDKVTAMYARGVLEIFIPRAETDREKRILVKAS